MFSKSFYELLLVMPKNMFSKYVRNHGVTHNTCTNP